MGLAHAAALGGVGPGEAQGGLAQADRLEADADAGACPPHQHQLEALAALADQVGGAAVEGDGGGGGALVAELLEAVQGGEALAGRRPEVLRRPGP